MMKTYGSTGFRASGVNSKIVDNSEGWSGFKRLNSVEDFANVS